MPHAERLRPPASSTHAEARTSDSSGIQRIKQVYNTYLVSHRKRIRQLCGGEGRAVDDLDELDTGLPDAPERMYPVADGEMTFAQLHQRTSRIVGATLRDVYGMTNPEDIDDSIQSGYLKVWQKLQDNPDLFKGKPIRYVVTGVVMRSKAQRYAHLRHNHKLVFDADPNWLGSADDLKAHRVDTWIDLADAIGAVSHAVMEEPVQLLALYTLITQAKAQHVRKLYGHSSKAITTARGQVRATLAEQLPGYGPQPEADRVLPLPDDLEKPAAERSVIAQILEGIHDTTQTQRVRPRPSRPVNGAGRVEVQERQRAADRKQHLRAAIRPFRTNDTQDDPAVATGWSGGQMRLSELMADPQVRKAAYAKAYQLGLSDEADIDDCLQRGFTRLWQKLEKTPDLLADKGPVWAGIYVTFSGDTRRTLRHNQRQQRFTDPDFDWSDADEHLSLGVPDHQPQAQAKWSVAVDETADIEKFMTQMAEAYDDDFMRLVALYALTTSVQFKDAASMLSIAPNNYNAQVGRKVKQEVQAAYRAFAQQQ